MYTYETIMERLKEIGIDTFMLPKKELKELPEALNDDETLLYLVQGMYSNGVGVLCVTDKRLLFIDKGFFFGLKIEEFPLKSISSISQQSGVMMAKIKIHASGNNAEISNVDKVGAKELARIVSELIENTYNSTSSIPKKNNDNVIEQLEKLSNLKEKGFLTDDEFQQEKVKILKG